ncbi:MAG TPA: polyphosphate kinase 1 [Longimicrobiales bacterium]
MLRERVLRLEVLSRELLEWLVEEPLPAGVREESTELDLFRSVYFDTPGGDLERRGATVRLCIRRDGTHVLSVDVREREVGAGLVQRSYAEAEVPALPPPDLFAGDFEAARIIRALVDPARLSTAMELETTRRVRVGVFGEEPPARVRIAYDIAIVRRDDIVGELYEVELRMPDAPPGRFEGLARAFEDGYGLHPLLGDVVGRARDLVSALESDELAARLRAAREVAVVAYDQGRVALCRSGGEGFRVPTGPGSGREACHRVLRGWLGGVRGRVRVLGTSPGTSQHPALEVWLAEGIDPSTTDAGRCVWLPLEHVLEAAGAAHLRDARTLAALALVARSDLPARAAAVAAVALPDGASHETAEPLELVAHRAEAEEAEVLAPKEVRPELLLNRELCRLAFDERILVMAEDERVPLLERVRFIAIFGSRQDDFFMTRVAESKEQVAAGITRRTPDGLTPAEQLDIIRIRARQVAARAYRLLIRRMLGELERAGVCLLRWADLDEDARRYLMDTYWGRIEALITPLVTDPSHPFPHIRNLRPAIAAVVRLPEGELDRFVAIELPGELPRFLPLPDGRRFVPLEETIRAGLPRLYPGLDIVRAHTFRVTRSATSQLPEEAGDVMAAVEDELATRPFRQAVRLEVEEDMPEEMRRHLLRELRFEAPESASTLTEADVYAVPWLVDLAGLAEIAAIDIPALKYPPLDRGSPLEPGRSVFDQVRERDRLIAFPDHSFEATVGRFMAEAAEDPAVRSIKTTLYRTDADSPVVHALKRARSSGKDTLALVELKASFDERRNVDWARALDAAGVHVVFSPARYKIHAKIALVVRDEPGGIRRYVYIGSGNLNASTAAAYTDVGLLTADPELGEELNAAFGLLTGYSASTEFRRLLVSPFQMRRRFLELIEREAEHARAGRGGHIRAQMNGLSDRRIVAALYRASRAGVRIELAVREICRVRPGLPGISENIRVVSLLGRLLQHSRIFYFANAGEPEYYIGSADWRPRNLLRRVEVAAPVDDPEHRATLDRMLTAILEHPDAWELRADGAYVRGDEVIGGIGTLGRWERAMARERRSA